MNANIYSKLRVWENITSMQKEPIPVVKNPLYEEEEDDFESSNEEAKKGIEQELAALGVDAEYIVTSFNRKLKKGMWVYNYYIEANKVENGGYVYWSYEGDTLAESRRENYETVEDAISTILSFYDWMEVLPTKEELLNKWNSTY